jgi:hypothetical protein
VHNRMPTDAEKPWSWEEDGLAATSVCRSGIAEDGRSLMHRICASRQESKTRRIKVRWLLPTYPESVGARDRNKYCFIHIQLDGKEWPRPRECLRVRQNAGITDRLCRSHTVRQRINEFPWLDSEWVDTARGEL